MLSDGTISEPNAVMRKAAEVILKFQAMGQADKAGRLKAEKDYLDTLAAYTQILYSMDLAKDAYRTAVNKDYGPDY